MGRVAFTATADADTAAILSYLAERAGRRTAARFKALFEAFYDRLADHPAIGPLRFALGPDIRIGIVSPYVIIDQQRDGEDAVTVLRIVDGRRRISGSLLVGISDKWA